MVTMDTSDFTIVMCSDSGPGTAGPAVSADGCALGKQRNGVELGFQIQYEESDMGEEAIPIEVKREAWILETTCTNEKQQQK